jgi:DNA-binding transcriptional ArsR family regulator
VVRLRGADRWIGTARSARIGSRVPDAGVGLDRNPHHGYYFGIYRNTIRRRERRLEVRMPLGDGFRALADPTRRQILRLLREGDRTAGEIAEHFPLAKSTLSGHFSVLKSADLVVTERRGTTIVYSLNTSAFEEIVAAMLELVEPSPGSSGEEEG